jgi:tetratricopeptide (TPR) repeat protein
MILMTSINRQAGYLVSSFLLILSLSSCTQFDPLPQEDLTAQVDAWIAANEYGKAIENIHYVQPEHPQYLELKNRQDTVLELAHLYEKKVSDDIEKMIKNKQWGKALDLVDQASKNYPDSMLIYESSEKLHQQQLQHIEKLEQRVLIERANWIQKALPLYKTLVNTDPRNKSLENYLEQLEYEAELLAEQLTWLAEEAIERKHFKTARLRMTMANNLSPEKQRTELLNRINQINTEKSKIVQNRKMASERREQEKKESQHQQALFDNIERSYSSGWLAITKSLINQLVEKVQQTPEIIELKYDVDKAIEYHVDFLFSQANKLYEEGQFEQSIEKWQEILIYEPENKLAQEHIQRAEKVIEKITQLREKQQQE